MDLCRKKVVVLDLTHGGIPIAKKLASLGNEVFAVDVYNTIDPNLLQELKNKYTITCSKAPLPVSEFDFLIAPVHLDPAYPMLAEARAAGVRILSHHEIVGIILKSDPRLSDKRVVEVTGVKAKTSTSSLLADMLSRNSDVVLHTSRGLELWKTGNSSILKRGLSITPGSILVAVEEVFEAGLSPDFFVFEISIGGTGSADLGILTTLSPDYGIANNKALASDAKLQLIKNAKPGSCILINGTAEKALLAAKEIPVKRFTFKDPFIVPSEKYVPANNNHPHPDFEVEIKSRPEPESKLEPDSSNFSLSSDSVLIFSRDQKEIFSVPLLQGYDISAYRTAFLAASAAALELNIKPEDIVAVLKSFRGLSGRMQEKKIGGISLIDNSNSGMDILSAEKALEYALLKKKDEKKQGIILVLGEEASQVCEGLPPDTVQDFLKKFGQKFKQVILIGERMKRITAKNVSYATNLPEGLLMATEAAGEADIILSSVKCFR